MNIEGAEFEVLAESSEHLRMVREMIVEYHHLPGLPRTLHKILTLLVSGVLNISSMTLTRSPTEQCVPLSY